MISKIYGLGHFRTDWKKKRKPTPRKAKTRKAFQDFKSKQEYAEYMREHPTSLECILRGAARRAAPKYRLEEQVVIRGYIVDFLIPALMLVLEADGPMHGNQREYDAHRDQVLFDCGYFVMRFKAHNLQHNPQRIADLIREQIERIVKSRRK